MPLHYTAENYMDDLKACKTLEEMLKLISDKGSSKEYQGHYSAHFAEVSNKINKLKIGVQNIISQPPYDLQKLAKYIQEKGIEDLSYDLAKASLIIRSEIVLEDKKELLMPVLQKVMEKEQDSRLGFDILLYFADTLKASCEVFGAVQASEDNPYAILLQTALNYLQKSVEGLMMPAFQALETEISNAPPSLMPTDVKKSFFSNVANELIKYYEEMSAEAFCDLSPVFSFKNIMARIKKFALDDEEINSLRARLITIIQKNFNSICKNIDPLITLIDEIEVEDKESFFEQRLTSNNLINLNPLSSAESFINKVAVINSLPISDKSKCTILSVFIVQSFCSIKNNKDLALVIGRIALLNYQDANTKELLPLLINQLINHRDNVLEVKDLSSFYETIGLIKTALKDQGPKAVAEQMYRFIKKFTPSTAKDARYFDIKNFKLKSVLAEIYTRHPDLATPLKDKYSKSKKLFNACGNLFQFKKKQNVLDELGQQQGFKNH